ncbi:GNAT family N-acetyltransferase [Agrococcus versicolor]|uniref:GNAT family N-acetyltransferase n=1 Tax=Agrococcus versicolor TaxID=501482 RepID=A0ABP5MR82_9MICO
MRKAESGDRFEILDDAGAIAGRAYYVDSEGSRIFFHTKVDDAYAGQGLGRTLVTAALDATREDGLQVMAMCPYVARLVERDHQWDDVVVPVSEAAIAAVERRTQG